MKRAKGATLAEIIETTGWQRHMAITSAFLFVRSEALPARFLAAGAFFAGFAFLLTLGSPLVGAAATSRLIL